MDQQTFVNQQLRSAQTLLTVSMISAPVSLLIGGVLLGAVAIVCACIARGKVKSALAIEADSGIALRLMRQSSLAIGMAVAATAVNLVFAVIAFTYLYDMMMSGQLESYVDAVMQGDPAPQGDAPSVWDR